jgi:hypothetical protein
MKKLLLLLILTVTTMLFADFVQIGDTEATSYETPVCGVYDYGWSESLYRQSEIGDPIVIYELAYYVSNSPSFYTLYNQSIYIKTTPDTLIALADYPNPATHDYTLVFQGDVIFNGAWNSITLNTPFSYDGVNSLSILWINEDGDFNTGHPHFYHMPTTDNRIKYNNQDGSFPTTLGTLAGLVPTIRLHYYGSSVPDIPFDIWPYHQQEEVTIATGIYWLNGSSTSSNQVYFGISQSDLDLIYDGPAIQEVTNSQLGGYLEQDTDYFLEIIAINENGQVSTGVKSFHTLVNQSSTLVGIGSEVNIGLPWEPEERYSYTQSIYQSGEVFDGNIITSLSYYWTGVTVFSNDTEIYMGATDKNRFDSNTDWIPIEELTLVFHGDVHQVQSNSWLTIQLDQPYLIDHSQNIVIAFREMTNLFESTVDNFACTATATQRSLTCSSMSSLPDPANPPTGVRKSFLPNTRFYFLQDEEIAYFNDDFEHNPDFALDFAPWISRDLDGNETITYEDHEFPNAVDPKGFMIFNSLLPVPSVPGTSTHSGSRMAVSFPGVGGNTNDWLISPLWDVPSFYLGELDGLTVTFWAKSHIIQSAARSILKIMYSDGSSDPDDFVMTEAYPTPIFLPTDWTEYTFTVPPTETGQVRIAFNSITAGYSVMFIDDVYAFVSLQNVPNDEQTINPPAAGISAVNYPNPFNPETNILFSIPENTDVSLNIYNIKGQKIDTLVNSRLSAGQHNLIWKGKDSNNNPVPSGVYLYKLKAGTYTLTKKMILLK